MISRLKQWVQEEAKTNSSAMASAIASSIAIFVKMKVFVVYLTKTMQKSVVVRFCGKTSSEILLIHENDGKIRISVKLLLLRLFLQKKQ